MYREMILQRDSILPILQPDLRELDLSYYELVKLMGDETRYPPLKVTIKLLRLFLLLPVRVVIPKVTKIEKKNRRSTIFWGAEEIFGIDSDKELGNSAFKINLVWNGLKYVAPLVNKAIGNLQHTYQGMLENIHDAIGSTKQVLDIIPPSTLSVGVSQAMVYLKAADNVLQTAKLHTGYAHVSQEDSPFVPVGTDEGPTKSRKRKRLPSQDGAPAAAGAPEDQPSTQLTPGLPVGADCTMEFGRCGCGMLFPTKEELDAHIKTLHENNYLCSKEGCDHIYPGKDSCWRHYRTAHLKRYHYCCRECDPPYHHDDPFTMKKHLADRHGGQSELKCEKCGKVEAQKSKFELHKRKCGHHVKLFFCSEANCYKGFRSKYWLTQHVKSVHRKEGEAPIDFPCPYPGCVRKYSSKQARVKHQKDCKHTTADIDLLSEEEIAELTR